jgi:hypothetical protein
MTFSIRDLFLVTMIVALAVGWWLDRTKLAHDMARLSKLSPTGVQGSFPRHDYHVSNPSAPAPNPLRP